MDAVKQWIICIIFCSLIAAVVNILSPKNGTQRAMKTVVAAFLICAFLSPFIVGSGIETDEKLPDFSDYQSSLTSDITEAMLLEAENLTEIKTAELLVSLNVEYDDIKAEAAVNSENSIYIDLITITLDEKFKFREKQITSNLKTMFSSEVKYIWVKK